MKSQTEKLGIALVILALVALVVIWAINGYEDTWLYASAMLIAIPTSWIHFCKKNKDK